MLITMPDEKINKIQLKCRSALADINIKIQIVAELVGSLVACFPASTYGFLYTRQLEYEKTQSLRLVNGNFSAAMQLSDLARQDIQWWLDNLDIQNRSLRHRFHDLMITSDASPIGWGAECGGLTCKGNWTPPLSEKHINVLELWAAFYGLRTFANKENIYVHLRVDSSNAMAYINRFGGCRSPEQHKVAKELWQWCEARNILIRATYINTKDNFVADALSPQEHDSSDFMLNKDYYGRICAKFGCPQVDLFASHQTTQCEIFYSWRPDPYSIGIDAFNYLWKDFFYALPPFSLIGRVINKIIVEKCRGILVVPDWPSQPWFPLFKRHAVSDILRLGPNKKLLINPYRNESHLINSKFSLLVAKLSGNH